MKLKTLMLLVTLPLICQCTEKTDVPKKIGRIDALILYYNQTDGALVFPAVEILYSELQLNPINWYSAMASDSIAFIRFIEDLEAAVFVAKDSCITIAVLESMKKQDLNRLLSLNVPSQLQAMHERLVSELKEIQPRAFQ